VIEGSVFHSERGLKAVSRSSMSKMTGTWRISAATRAAPKVAI
jgi:hypothetical protein